MYQYPRYHTIIINQTEAHSRPHILNIHVYYYTVFKNLSTLLIALSLTRVILVILVILVVVVFDFDFVIWNASHPSRRTLIIRSSQGENPALVSARAHGSGKRAQTSRRSDQVMYVRSSSRGLSRRKRLWSPASLTDLITRSFTR